MITRSVRHETPPDPKPTHNFFWVKYWGAVM